MATRFYLPSTGAGATTPNFAATWEDTSIATRLRMVTTKISSAMTTVSFNDANSADRDILFRQYISDPIAGQTIASQVVTANARYSQTNAANNMVPRMVVRVIADDGTVRGTITDSTGGTEAATSLTGRLLTAGASTQVVSSDGDRIVLEIGLGGNPTGAAEHDSSMSVGDDSASDLDETETDTGADNPYLNFANTITFASAPTVTTAAVSDITLTTATGNGNVTADNDSPITERGVCWKTSTGPTTADSKATSAGTTGVFTANITGLSPGVHYYVRAYAINNVGTSYGSEVEFDTLSWPGQQVKAVNGLTI